MMRVPDGWASSRSPSVEGLVWELPSSSNPTTQIWRDVGAKDLSVGLALLEVGGRPIRKENSIFIFLAHNMVDLPQMAQGIGLGVWAAIDRAQRVAFA